MSDWAVERARAVFAAGNVGSTERIAAALRQARIEALEEAENALKGTRTKSKAATAIRALKDKQP